MAQNLVCVYFRKSCVFAYYASRTCDYAVTVPDSPPSTGYPPRRLATTVTTTVTRSRLRKTTSRRRVTGDSKSGVSPHVSFSKSVAVASMFCTGGPSRNARDRANAKRGDFSRPLGVPDADMPGTQTHHSHHHTLTAHLAPPRHTPQPAWCSERCCFLRDRQLQMSGRVTHTATRHALPRKTRFLPISICRHFHVCGRLQARGHKSRARARYFQPSRPHAACRVRARRREVAAQRSVESGGPGLSHRLLFCVC